MKQNFWFSINLVNVNLDWMKVYGIQSKNGITINVGVSVKN